MSWIDDFEFELDEETRMVRDAARQFAQKDVLPLAAKVDQEHYYPEELIPKLGELGFLGACVHPNYGGSGLDQVPYCLIIEELAAACASTSVIVSAHNSLCIAPIKNFGSEEQKETYLPDLCSGKSIGCFALSEPGTGSDAAALTCVGKKDGNGYIINGTKNWITNGPVAGTCVLFATLDPSAGYRGVAAFVHPMDMPGISLGKKEDKLGIRGSPTCSISYENVKLGPEHLIDKEGRGFNVAMHTLNGGRTGIGAQAVGIARAALYDALEYSKQRKAFGVEICKHQSIQNYLAEMIVSVDAARYLTLAAARRKDRGQKYVRQAAMAKWHASEVAMRVADLGIQIHGGYGYVTEFPAERHLRDAKITQIYEGTSEIQKMVIASELLKE